ncbi:hypothetical protein BXZ70DRAFT_468945 [Cristinia sonorae]|uniref:Uncharacterized protein n=1 Tax=Cristinia sonorae TaxID=1940300 RepID=A0A8K0UHB2_9AGAR|nr:hypothetical protein BXZ70DRAFT_468945 [Cristinia sonorae]
MPTALFRTTRRTASGTQYQTLQDVEYWQVAQEMLQAGLRLDDIPTLRSFFLQVFVPVTTNGIGDPVVIASSLTQAAFSQRGGDISLFISGILDVVHFHSAMFPPQHASQVFPSGNAVIRRLRSIGRHRPSSNDRRRFSAIGIHLRTISRALANGGYCLFLYARPSSRNHLNANLEVVISPLLHDAITLHGTSSVTTFTRFLQDIIRRAVIVEQ